MTAKISLTEKLRDLKLASLAGAASLVCFSIATGILVNELAEERTIRKANVIGADAPEKFYEINGQRVYLEIDGKPVEQYVRGGQ